MPSGGRPLPTQASNPANKQLEKIMALYKAGRFAEAITSGVKLSKTSPNLFPLWNVLGAAFAQTGQFKNAVVSFQRAAKLNPGQPDPHNNLGNALKGLGQTDAAKAAYQRALAVSADHPLAHNNLAVMLFEEGQLGAAEGHIRKALSVAPKYAEAHNNLGNILQARGAIEEAKAAYRSAVECNPNFAEAHYNLGVVAQKLGQDAEAESHYLRAIQLRPNHVQALRNLGVALKNREIFDKAQAATERALEFEPDHVDTLTNLGLILAEAGKQRQALVAFDRALQHDPDHVPAILGKADALKKNSRLSQAITVLEDACQKHPDAIELLANLGLMLVNQGKPELALEKYEAALAKHPDASSLLLNRALAFQELGDQDRAITSVVAAIDADPENETAMRNLAAMPQGALDKPLVERLRAYYEGHKDLIKPESRRNFFAADICRHEGDLDGAFAYLQRANAARLEAVADDLHKAEGTLNDLADQFAAWQPRSADPVDPDITPIFIFAPSRSGKSLLERLLSRSPVVTPFYEAIKDVAKGVGPLSLDQVFYAASAELLANGQRVVTSTNPHSLSQLMPIADGLANAVFVFVRRDPFDIGSEMFAYIYGSENEYSYDARAIMQYIDAYTKLTDQLLTKLGARATVVQFADLLGNPSAVLRQVEALSGVALEIDDAVDLPKTVTSKGLFRDHFKALVEGLGRNHD